MELEATPIVAEVIRLVTKKPFEPFSLVTRDGMRFLITKSGHVAASDDRVVVMDAERGVCFFRSAQLASVEPVLGAA